MYIQRPFFFFAWWSCCLRWAETSNHHYKYLDFYNYLFCISLMYLWKELTQRNYTRVCHMQKGISVWLIPNNRIARSVRIRFGYVLPSKVNYSSIKDRSQLLRGWGRRIAWPRQFKPSLCNTREAPAKILKMAKLVSPLKSLCIFWPSISAGGFHPQGPLHGPSKFRSKGGQKGFSFHLSQLPLNSLPEHPTGLPTPRTQWEGHT